MIRTIYRIEDREGNGPFHSRVEGAHEVLDLERYKDSMTYPSPSDDPKIYRFPEENELCGCISMGQMIHWFNKEEIQKLMELGFFLVEIQIEDSYITYGITQILFQKPHIIKHRNIQTKFSN